MNFTLKKLFFVVAIVVVSLSCDVPGSAEANPQETAAEEEKRTAAVAQITAVVQQTMDAQATGEAQATGDAQATTDAVAAADANDDGASADEDSAEASGETTTPEGFTVNWTMRQEGDDLIVTYKVTDAEGNPVTGTGFATIVIKDGNPGGSGARHNNGSFDENGLVELILELIHPPGTEIDAWLFFEQLQNSILFTTITLGQ